MDGERGDVQETNSLNHSIPQRVCAQANAEKKNSKTSNLPRSLPGEIEREWKALFLSHKQSEPHCNSACGF
jgi:hypothetical protein